MARYIVLDTETTGLRWAEGHRVFEIGMVETLDFKTVSREKSIFINPCVDLSEESMEICKVTNEQLRVYPPFSGIVDEFLEFLYHGYDRDEKTVLFAHNAKFDIGFLNFELALCDKNGLSDFVVIDTVRMAKVAYPGQPASLDQLCKKFDIDLGEREEKGHGAMLDSRLLYEILVKMVGSKGYNEIINFDKISDNFFGFFKRDIVLSGRSFDDFDCDIDSHKAVLGKIKVLDVW